MSTVLSHRGRIAALSRSRTPADPELVDARRDLAAEKLAEHIKQVVDGFPPLSDEQRLRLASLLRASGGSGADAAVKAGERLG